MGWIVSAGRGSDCGILSRASRPTSEACPTPQEPNDVQRCNAAVPGRIEQLEASTGAVQASISAPGLTGVTTIEAIGP
jgi:hypothetical protein